MHFVLVPILMLTAGAAPSAALLASPPDLDAAARAAIAQELSLLDGAATARQLEDARSFGLACDTVEATCAAAFGKLVAVEEVVTVVAERLGGGRFVRAARVDVRRALTLRSVGGRAEAESDVTALVASLFQGPPVALSAPVKVSITPATAMLSVDGVPVTPIDGVVWTAPGAHVFEASVNGARASRAVEVPSDGRIGSVTLSIDTAATAAEPAASAATTSPGSTPSTPSTMAPTIAIVAGGLAGVAGAAMWIGADEALKAPMLPDDRAVTTTVGLAGVALVVVGAATAGIAGATLVSP